MGNGGTNAAREAALSFIDALASTPAVRAQNRLLNTADRDLAAVLYPLEEGERDPVYLAVGSAKAARLRSELARMGHVRLDGEIVSRIAAHLAEHLSAERPLAPASRYFKPKTPKS